MNCPKTVQSATPRLISSAPTTDAFQSKFSKGNRPFPPIQWILTEYQFRAFIDNGHVTLPTTAVMEAMSLKHNVRANTVIALNLNSVAAMANAFHLDGVVIMR